MSDLSNFLNSGGDAALRRVNTQAESAGSLFADATWDQVGTNKQLTDFLHQSLDPNGSKYGGDSDALKEDLLNTTTARGSSALASIWDFAKSTGEGTQTKRFQNLVSRLYENAPNRLVSGDANQTYQAIKSGLLGGAIYDAPLLIATAGIGNLAGLGAKGLAAAGKTMLGESAAKLAATEMGADAVAQAGSQLAKDAMMTGVQRGAIREGAENAAFGVVGDAAQQGAGMNRGTQDDFNTGQMLTAALLGGGIGAVAGGVHGGMEGRAMGKELSEALPQAASDKVWGKAVDGLPPAEVPGVSGDFVALADAHRNAKANLQDAADDVSQFVNRVIAGEAKSEYTPAQLSAIRSALVEARNSNELSTSLQAQATALRSSPTPTPEAILKAGELEQQAAAYEGLIKHINTIQFEHPEAILVNGDVSPELVSGLAAFNPRLAAALGKVEVAAATPAAKAKGSLALESTTSPATKTVAQAAPAAPGAKAGEVPAPTPTEQIAVAPLPPAPETPTAKDVATMVETKFSDDEKAAYATLNDALGKTNMDLQAALDTMATKGQGEVVAAVAKESGVDRATVQDAMTKVTAATQREYNKALADHDTMVQAAAAAEKQKPALALESPSAPATETIATHVAGDLAKLQEASAAVDQQISAAVDELAVTKADLQYERMAANLDGQVAEISKALDAGLADIDREVAANLQASKGDPSFAKLSVDEKAGFVKKALDKAKVENPDLAPMIDELDPAKMTTKKGVEAAKVKMQTLAKDSITWMYSKAIGDILPDALNVEHFDTVVQALLRNAPAGEADRISNAYRGMVRSAIVDRITNTSIDFVMKDPVLGPAWQRIINGEGGHQKFGGLGPQIHTGALIQHQAGRVLAAMGGAPITRQQIVQVGAIVRDFRRQLRATGIPLDSKLMSDAVAAKALSATEYVLSGQFKKDNLGDFEKLAKLSELRREDATRSETQSLNLHRMQGSIVGNPILQRVENPSGVGGWSSRMTLVSGRSQGKDGKGVSRLGNPQGILSDGISDYLGTLWAHPRKMFAAATMARKAIYGAAVDAASWSRGSMVIAGLKKSGSLKELKGQYKELAPVLLEQSRFANILDAAQRRRLDEGAPGYLGADAYDEHIKLIGSHSRPVTKDEQAIAELFLDSQAIAENGKAVARASMAEILADNKLMGDSAASQINAIVSKLDTVLSKNGNSTMRAMKGYGLGLDDAAARSKPGENSVKGTPAKAPAKAAEDKSKANIENGGRVLLIVRDDGTIIHGTRDENALFIHVKGVQREVIPSQIISMNKNGDVTLYGTKVGTWKRVAGADHAVVVVAKGIEDGLQVQDFTKLVSRDKFRKAHLDIFDANSHKMVKAAPVAESLPDGAQVAVELSNTQAVKAAEKEVLAPGKLAEADLDRAVSSFDVPADSILVIKSASDIAAKSPGPLQGNMTVRAFAKLVGIAPEDVRIGTVRQTILKSGELRGKSMNEKLNYPGVWTPLGRDTGTVDQAIVQKVAQKKENTPLMAQAQNRAINEREAGKIVLNDQGQTLADVATWLTTATTTLKYDQIGTRAAYDALLAKMDESAKIVESLAPHGIRKDNASRATSFHWLQDRMAAFTPEERGAAFDFMRRLDTDHNGMPYFMSNEAAPSDNYFWMSGGKSGIGLNKNRAGTGDLSTPKHVIVMHEVAHWAYTNMLSPSEQVAFVRSLGKFYTADGMFDERALLASMPTVTAMEKNIGRKLSGVRDVANELFAWQFTNYAMDKTVGAAGAALESSLWDRVIKIGKNILAHFLGQPVDKELVPLFERIMPSVISENKFDYNRLRDKHSGKLVTPKELTGEQASAAAVTGMMEKIDTLRGRIRQHLFVPGAVADVGFAEDLRAAAGHMLGLLYGKDQTATVSALRRKLNPMSGGKLREGMVDHRELFSRTEHGKLIQAINDVVPAGRAENVVFEAIAGTEEFNTLLKSSAIGDNPEVAMVYKQALEQEFTRLMKAGGKESEALEAADLFALKEAASHAQESLGVDISSTVFDNGVRAKLGTDQQREALGGVARKLHDLMSDSLDYLETEVGKFGLAMQRVTREVQPPAPEVSKAMEVKVAKSSRKTKPKTTPATEQGVKVAAAEEAARVDGVATGVPVATEPQRAALIARVPHRDKAQADIIGAAMDRLLAFIVKGEDGVTNGDIARITGVALEDGVKPDAMTASTTEAFDALRKGMRLMSEELTNSSKKPKEAMDFIADMLIRDRMSTIVDDVGADVLHGEKMVPLSEGFVRSQLVKFIKGEEVDPMLSSHLEGIYADTKHVLSGLGQTAEASRAVGTTVATGKAAALRLSDGTYHPALVRSSVTNRLQGLPLTVAQQVLKDIGVRAEDGGEAAALSANVAYRIKGNPKVFATVDEMMAQAAELSGLKDEVMRNINSELSKAMAKGDMDLAMKLATWYEVNSNGVGATPVFVNMAKVYDPMMASAVQKDALQAAMDSGKYKTQQSALKSMGFEGVQEGEQIKLFSQKSARDLEATITGSLDSLKASNVVPDAPLGGEIFLNYGVLPEATVNPLAVEQRALQAGAPAKIAKIMGNMFKRGKDESGLSDEAMKEVRSFHGVQIRSNASRILQAGGEWLANRIAPVNGTGFEEAMTTKLSTVLLPLVDKMNKFAGADNWLKKAGYEIYRNLDVREHKIPQSKAEARVAMAMRTNDTSGLSMEEKAFKQQLNDHFRSLLKRMNDADIPVADITDATNQNYLPQRFNLDWIRANREEAINKLGKWFEKDRGASESAVNARHDAAKVINEAINREELQGILDGASSTYTQAFGDKLHQRKLHIVGKDWEDMHMMFDNNLRSLTTSYTEAAIRRIEWAENFGVRGHAAATYTDIGGRGADAAMDALMGKAAGMKRVYDMAGQESDLIGQYAAKEAERTVESVSSLFSAVTSDPQTAGAMVKQIMDALDVSKDDATKAGLVEALVKYHADNGGYGTNQFRKRAEAIVHGLADFGEDGKSVAKHEVGFMQKMVGVLGGRPAYTIDANQGLRDAAGAVKMFNSVTLLSGSVLSSLGDPVMSLMRSGSMKDWLNGTAKAVRLAMDDPATVDAMARVGVTMESILHENITHVSGGISGRISNAFFNANMLTPWTNAQRQVAALVGFESIRSNQVIAQRERFAGNMDSWKYRKAIKYLRELGLAHLVDAEKLDNFALGVQDQKVAQAVHKFTNESVFQPNRNDMPLWTQDPIASIFWQFKSYPTMMGRLAKKNFKDAISFEGGSLVDKALGKEVGKYNGDPMGLVYLLSIGSAFGAGSMAVKDVVQGKNQEAGDDSWRSVRDRRLSKMVQEFGFKDFSMDNDGADLVIGTLAQGFLGIGALGMLGDMMYQSAKSVDNGAFGRERIMSQIAGPTLGTFSDTIQLLDGARVALKREEGQDTGSSQERNAVRKIAKRVPFIGNQDPWVETFVNATAGPLENPPEPAN